MDSSGITGNIESKRIEQWKVKRMKKKLEASRGNGTSMVTLVLPPSEVIGSTLIFLGNEYSQAASIKSKQTMNSV